MISPHLPAENLNPDPVYRESSSENNCDLGSIYFQTDFARTPTDCFGAGGYYEMSELDGLWVFFTMNFSQEPLDFMMVVAFSTIILKNSIGQKIKSIGLVAGFKDFTADICLSEIGFY